VSDPFPVLTLRLGDEITAVDEASDVKTGLREVEDFDMVLYTKACVVRYAHPEKTFSLPPTRFVSLDVALAKVARVVTSPQLAYATADEMSALVTSLFRLFAGAAWTGPGDATAALQRVDLALADAATDEATVNAGVWADGAGTEIRLDVKRTHTPGGKDLFLVNVAVTDPARYAALCDEVRSARQRAGLPTDRRRVILLQGRAGA
jgi:hypothetical protein